MPSTAQVAPGRLVFHVVKQANHREEMLEKDANYLTFLPVMRDTLHNHPVRIFLERSARSRTTSSVQETGVGEAIGGVDSAVHENYSSPSDRPWPRANDWTALGYRAETEAKLTA